jgi:hypothetical protein
MPINGGKTFINMGQYVVDRIQTSGPGALNIPDEKIIGWGNRGVFAETYEFVDPKIPRFDYPYVHLNFLNALANEMRKMYTSRDFAFVGTNQLMEFILDLMPTSGAYIPKQGFQQPQYVGNDLFLGFYRGVGLYTTSDPNHGSKVMTVMEMKFDPPSRKELVRVRFERLSP